jgi:hypothetical protein
MNSLLAPPFRAVAKAMPGKALTLLDAGCGNSYLSLAFAFLAREAGGSTASQIRDWQVPVRISTTSKSKRKAPPSLVPWWAKL